MSVETELKLRIAPEHLARLKRHPMLKEFSVGRAVTRRVYSVYYDTPEFDLNRRAMALRLRREGRGWVQTLKGGGTMRAGLHSRDEWESRVNNNAPDFDALQASGGKLPLDLREKLRPVFVTDFSRTIRMVAFAGGDKVPAALYGANSHSRSGCYVEATIELSFDSGEVRAEGKVHPISELELELKSGAPLQLFRLALALLDIVPLEIEQTNKAEYGYALLMLGRQNVAKAHIPVLTAEMDTTSALQGMVWASLRHLQANVPGAVGKLDDEYLHQVRVALRRLRVALGMIGTFCPEDAELAALREEVGALCKALGRSREWDVFVADTLPSVDARELAEAMRKRIARNSERLRQQHHAQLQTALQGKSFQRLLLRLGAWMNESYLADNAARVSSTLPVFASQVLQRRNKQVNRLGKEIERASDAGRLHEFRIACKKLRYSAESFASLYAKNRTGNYLAALAKLQDVLGAINDIAVARRLLNELSAAMPREDFSVVRSSIERDYAKLIPKLNRAWKAFYQQGEFWR